MEYLCSICQCVYHPRNVRECFCNSCYHTYNDDILNNVAWIQVAVNTERQRRRRESRDIGRVIYLNDRYDVGNFSGEYKLVPTSEYYEEWD